ncbi:hypothetical protein LTR33_000702 [Friedmanniomyces endolithicus]|nr:hypothetical protein LTR33_000702 [Friedmanniomyces endolithicus]
MSNNLEILENYGTTIGTYEHSLPNALELAKGRLPLVVVMQEPCNLADEVPYEEMVYGDESAEGVRERVGCPALQQVEHLAEEVSGGTYSLEDFSVFDINTLHSKDMQDDLQNLEADLHTAHQTFWKMLTTKAPKVILVLTCTACSSQYRPLKSLYSSRISAATEDTITLWRNSTSHKATVIRAFHPSVYLRVDYIEAEKWSQDEVLLANKILRLCFAKAFRILSGEPCAEDDREEALLQAWKDTVGARNRSRALKEISRNANLQNQVPLVLADKMGALSIGGK